MEGLLRTTSTPIWRYARREQAHALKELDIKAFGLSLSAFSKYFESTWSPSGWMELTFDIYQDLHLSFVKDQSGLS